MYVKVKVRANQKKEVVEKIDDETFSVFVKEKAERNMANKRVLELIAVELDLPKEALQIVTGHHSPNKIIFIRNQEGS